MQVHLTKITNEKAVPKLGTAFKQTILIDMKMKHDLEQVSKRQYPAL